MLKYLKTNIKFLWFIMKSSRLINRSLLCFSLILGYASNSIADILSNVPEEGQYQAEYRVYWHGIYAANAYQAVERLANNHYIAHMRVTPRLPFIPFEYDEKSTFVDTGSVIQPVNFSFKWREKKKRLNGSVRFDWENHQHTTFGDAFIEEPMTLLSLPQDKVSLVFQLSKYLEKNSALSTGKTWSHQVVEAKKQKTYVFEILKKEQLKTPLGVLQTLKIRQSAANSARYSHLWFAIDKQYLLVKIAQFKQDNLMGYTLIHKLQF